MSAPMMNERMKRKKTTLHRLKYERNNQTGLPKNKLQIKTRNKLNGYRHIPPQNCFSKTPR